MKASEIDMKNFHVKGNRVLLRKPVKKEKDTYIKRESGILVASGSEEIDNSSKDLLEVFMSGNPDISVGDMVIMPNYFNGGMSFVNGDYEYTIMGADDIMGVVSQE